MYFVSLFKDLYSNHDCGRGLRNVACMALSDNTLLLHRVLLPEEEEEGPRCMGGGGDKGEGDGGGGKGRRGREGGVS